MKKEKSEKHNKKKKYEIRDINYTIICNSNNNKEIKDKIINKDTCDKYNVNNDNNTKNIDNLINKENGKLNENKKSNYGNLNEKILVQINNLNYMLSRGKVIDLIELTGDSKKFLLRSFTSGIAKGIGAGIGFSIVTALIIYLLQKIIKLNIPVISQYISDIIEIVQNTKN